MPKIGRHSVPGKIEGLPKGPRTVIKGVGKSTSLIPSIIRKAPSGRTRIQKAASQVGDPKLANGRLCASDADVLRIAGAIAEQRKELMNRLAQ
jgi:hypothetical protein